MVRSHEFLSGLETELCRQEMVFKIIFLSKVAIKLHEIVENGHCKIKTLSFFPFFKYLFCFLGAKMKIAEPDEF